MKTGIYMIRNKINDKKYIGQAVDIDRRWSEHIRKLNDNNHYNSHLQNAWNKYGEDNFEFTIIHECDEETLDELEIMYIEKYNSFKNGYNLTLGGEGTRGYKYTDEQRAKMSETMKEALNRPEVKAKISENMKEYYKDPENRKKASERTKEVMNRPEVKKKHRESVKEALNRPEVKAKISENMKEYYKDPENRKKTGEAMKEVNKRRWSDPEYKAKMSETMKEVLNRPEVKAKMSKSVKEALNRPEVKKKMSEALKGKPPHNRRAVYCVTNNTVYASLTEAGEKLSIDRGSIGQCCKGKYIAKSYPDGHHVKGLEFWFLDEYEEKQRQYEQLPPLLKLQLKYEQAYKKAVM